MNLNNFWDVGQVSEMVGYFNNILDVLENEVFLENISNFSLIFEEFLDG